MKKNKWFTSTIDNIEQELLYFVINSKTHSTKKPATKFLHSWLSSEKKLFSNDDMILLWET